MSVFSDNINKLRTNKGLSQRQLAAVLDVSKATVGSWESTNTVPTLDRLIEISKYFGVSVASLFSENLDLNLINEFVRVELFSNFPNAKDIESSTGEVVSYIPSRLYAKYSKSFLIVMSDSGMNRLVPKSAYVLIDSSVSGSIDPVFKSIDIDDGEAYLVGIGKESIIRRVFELDNGFELRPYTTDATIKSVIIDFNSKSNNSPSSLIIYGKVVWFTMPWHYEIQFSSFK